MARKTQRTGTKVALVKPPAAPAAKPPVTPVYQLSVDKAAQLRKLDAESSQSRFRYANLSLAQQDALAQVRAADAAVREYIEACARELHIDTSGADGTWHFDIATATFTRVADT